MDDANYDNLNESIHHAMAKASVPTRALELTAEWYGIKYDPNLPDMEKRDFIRKKAQEIVIARIKQGESVEVVIDGCVDFLASHGYGPSA